MSALVEKLAARYGTTLEDMEAALRQAMPQPLSPSEFLSCCAIAYEQGLNPLMKDVSFEREQGSIHPIVHIDAWIRKCNEHEQYDGIEFEDKFDAQGRIFSIKATIFRKDRSRPTSVIEYLSECARDTANWKQMPARNLRHRSLAQCARVAFGFVGMSPDEFAQWRDRSRSVPVAATAAAVSAAQPRDDLELPDFDAALPAVSPAETSPEIDQRYSDDQFIGSFETALCGARGPSDLAEIWDANLAEISERGLEQRASDMLEAYRKRHEAVAEKAPAAEPVASPSDDLEMPWETAETAPEKPAVVSDMAATAAIKGLEMRLGKVHNTTLVKEVWRNFQTIFTQLGPDAQALATKAKDAALVRVKKALQAAE